MELELNADFLQFDTNMSGIDQVGLLSTDFLPYQWGEDDTFANVPGMNVNLSTLTQYLETEDDHQDLPAGKNDSYPSKSPWHESDSGVSETLSFVGSPVSQGVNMENDQFLSDKEVSINLPPMNTGADVDLAAYLLGETGNGEFTCTNEEVKPSTTTISTLSAAGRPVRKCVRNKHKMVTTEESDSEEEMQVAETKKSVSAKPLSYFSEVPSYSSRSDIKIVKVVKPPACQADATTDDIMRALEEKSKKNAQQAKINREKKKVYIKSLEDANENYKKENQDLKTHLDRVKKEKACLEDEVDYLKSVLANASALSGLLKNISNVKEVKLSASITSRKRAAEDDHSYNLVEGVPEKRARLVKENLKKAGVCLHVSDGEACLEFCAHCSTLAQKTHGRRGK